MAPAPPLDHPLAAGGADPLAAAPASSRPRRMRGGEGVGVAGRARQHGVAVGAGHLGQGAAVGGHEAGAGGHRLDGGQREALVEAGHDGQLGLGVELDDALVGHAGHELTRRRRGRAARCGSAASPALRPADDRERDVPLGAQLGQRLQQVGEALQGDVGAGGRDEPAGHARDVGQRPEQLRVDADRHEAHAVVGDAEVVVDVVDRVLAHHDDARHAAGDPRLHLDERVPAADLTALAPARGVGDLQRAVLRDRVVQGDDRWAGAGRWRSRP